MKLKKHINFMIFFFLVVIIIFISYIVKKDESVSASDIGGPIFHADGTVTLPLGAISYGIKDPATDKVIDLLSVITPSQGVLNVNYHASQNMETSMEYLLLVLIDGIQRKFTVNNSEKNSYPIFREKSGETSVNIEIEIEDDTDKIIQFALFKQPGYVKITDNVFDILDITGSFSNLYYINNDNGNKRIINNYFNDAEQIEYNDNTPHLFVSDNPFGLDIMPSISGGKSMYVTVSNNSDYDMVYALGALLDWEQYHFSKDDLIQYIYMPMKSTKLLTVNAPSVNKDTPFQWYLIPYNAEGNVTDMSRNLIPSVRTVITSDV